METLCRELRLKDSPVGVSVLCPGSTVTDFMHNALERFEDDGGEPDRGDVARSEVIHGDLQRGFRRTRSRGSRSRASATAASSSSRIPDQVSTLLRQRFEALAADGTLAPLPWSA